MDALLRYILYHVAYTLLYVEVVLMVFFCFAIIVIKLISKWSTERREHIQSEISTLIEKALFSSEPLDRLSIPPNQCQFRNIVETLESFDYRFNDQRWTDIKDKIVQTYLIPQSESYAQSFSWSKRQLAARCFLLCPNKADEKLLKVLLKDPRYLVRVAAAGCITKISNRPLFYEVIQAMNRETTLSQFPYRDSLIQASQEKFEWLAEILSSEKDSGILAICLDVLSTRYSNDLLRIIKPFLKNAHRECRILAVRALGNIPSSETTDLLIESIQDSDWKIRAESIISLQKIFATRAIPHLKFMLNDPVWWVRLKSAMALKAFGEEGIKILAEQNKTKEPLAYEISQYILALP